MLADDRDVVQRLRWQGVQSASPIDLIAVGFSRSEGDAVEAEGMARKILKRYGGVRGIAGAGPADLAEMTGLDDFEVIRSQALIDIGRRANLANKGVQTVISSPEDAVALVVSHLSGFRHEKREHFFVILLDSKNQILKIETVHIGTLNMSLVGPREVFRVAIREGASSILLAHNHPSGDPTPSPEDIQVTESLAKIGKMLDIPVLDHLIIGDPNYTSLHDLGYV